MFTDRRIRTSLFAIAADLLLTALKSGLAWLTGSAALMADAYHSATDLVVSLVLLGSLVLRFVQENSLQTEGAQAASITVFNARRVESVLAVVVSLLILYVPYEIVRDLRAPAAAQISHLWVGIAGTLLVIALVHFMARLKTHVGSETDSPALEADGYHSKIDLFSSIAVLLSLIGLMIGVYVDEIVAVIIAVLIGIAGLELLVSGLRSLARGDELNPVSLLDLAGRWLSRLPVARWLSVDLAATQQAVQRGYRRSRWAILVMGLAIYAGTGFHRVEIGEIAIERQFAAVTPAHLAPGLHYTLPWPFGGIDRFPERLVYSTTAGSRFADAGNGSMSRLWRETTGTRAHEDDTAYLVTGDENLVDVEFALQYRLAEPVEGHRRFQQFERVVHRHLEAALWQQGAQHSFNQLLQDSHGAFASAIAKQLQDELASIGLPIVIIEAQVQALQPPELLVSVYRDRLDAEQEKEQRRNRAESQRTQDLLMASAERAAQEAEVEAAAMERRLMAEGEAEVFLQSAKVYAQHPRAMNFENHLRTLSNNLTNRPVQINDPAISNGDLRVWGARSITGSTGGRP